MGPSISRILERFEGEQWAPHSIAPWSRGEAVTSNSGARSADYPPEVNRTAAPFTLP
jgi:hypothetical protein